MVTYLTPGDSVGGRGGWGVERRGGGEGRGGGRHLSKTCRRVEGPKFVSYSQVGS